MRTVLVVDDEFGVAEVLEVTLEDEGFRVITAINGKQGMARLAETIPDLVILDYMMPLMDGAAMMAAMTAKPATANIPVIFMSSLDEAVVREICTGYRAFLRKPFRMKELLGVVSQVLGPE